MLDLRSPSPFGGYLRQLRIDKGLSQQTLAERANISVAAVCALERGRRKAPYRETLRMLTDALELDASTSTRLAEAATASRRARTRSHAHLASVGGNHNLPWHTATLHGRLDECGDLRRMVGSNRLVTVCGSAGVGKSRLATTTALDLVPIFPDGIRYLDLADARDHVAEAAIRAAVRRDAPSDERDGTAPAPSGGDPRLLLLLDNAELSLDVVERVVFGLLGSCRNLHVLVTSREPLRLRGGLTTRLAPLGIEDATDLLTDRIGGAPDRRGDGLRFKLKQICTSLDGLPLAIEICASRLASMGVDALLQRIGDPIRVLSGGPHPRIASGATFRDTIARSFDALTGDERDVLSEMAKFEGSFTFENLVAASPADADPWHVLDVASALVQKSLVEIDDASFYRLLNTTRAFVRERSRHERP